jgi:heme exporter protein C
MKLKFVIFAPVALALLAYAFYLGMFAAPTEATMGDVQRIFYYHVPSAWTAFLCFFANFGASIVYLGRRGKRADAFAVAAAEVGVVFCTVVLVTGPLWARPVWGIWWTWDARLTSTLILWLIYVSYLMLRKFAVGGQTPLLAAALAVFGFIDVPIVYLSIRYFRTQHPQPVIGGGPGTGLDPAMAKALVVNWLAFMVLAGIVIALRYRLELLRQQVEEEHLLREETADGGAVPAPQTSETGRAISS